MSIWRSHRIPTLRRVRGLALTQAATAVSISLSGISTLLTPSRPFRIPVALPPYEDLTCARNSTISIRSDHFAFPQTQ